MKFAVSNIQLRDGEITIDDQVLGKQHKIEKIQINVPFIANLPSKLDVFVAAAGADGDRRQSAANCGRGQAVYGDARLGG